MKHMQRDPSRTFRARAPWRIFVGLVVVVVGTSSAVLAQPAPPPDLRPQPRPEQPKTTREQPPDPFGPGRFRLPLLPGEAAPVGTTPRPTKEVQAEFNRFISGRVDPRDTLDLILGRPTVLLLKRAPKRVQLPDEKIASYDLIGETQLSVTGREIGTTVLNLWFADPDNVGKEVILSYLVRVLPDPEQKERLERVYQALAKEINHAFPDSVVHLALVGDKLVLTGQAKDIADATQILRIARSNAPGRAERIPIGNVNVNLNLADAGPDRLPEQGLDNFLLAGGPNVINLLHVAGVHQVLLRVTVAEVNRTAARSIGVNFSIFNKAGLPVFQQLTGNIAGQTAGGNGIGGASTGGGANNLPTILDNGQVAVAINALRNLDFARTLAEPTLVALNGHQANFQAGGEFPVPVVTGATATGLQGVNFVPFGVQLHFTPYITDKDLIRLQVKADVSTRDPSSGATINGANVPGLNTRNFDSTVELRSGQTLAVAGLIQTNFGGDAARVPFFGDLPLIGRLAAFDRTSSGEQEVVILITPELVQPLNGKECPPLPGSDVFEPTDVEFYLLGRLESRRPEDYRSPARTDLPRMIRGLHCNDLEMFGPGGYSDGKK
jgi:pilus assembly protein CpaC